tara:strand:+ start:112 stop:549 length:438 start_codon:yes stop_codon:yes gene_type:complete
VQVKIGKAKVELEGSDVTIVTFSKCVGMALEAAEVAKEKGISVEVINLRTIRPLDRDTVLNSIKKTNRLMTLEEGWPQHGVGAEIGAMVMEDEAFDYLDAPLVRLTGADVPMPYAIDLEKAALPQISNIVNAIENITFRGKKEAA